jgi:hypothetical protein
MLRAPLGSLVGDLVESLEAGAGPEEKVGGVAGGVDEEPVDREGEPAVDLVEEADLAAERAWRRSDPLADDHAAVRGQGDEAVRGRQIGASKELQKG